MASYTHLTPPTTGTKITISGGKLHVPDDPIIPFIEGDGIGPDIWKASEPVLDAAVEKAYGGARKIHWLEVYAGEKANNQYGEWLPQDTLTAIEDYLVAIKGPLTTPVGGGIRSLNVALRQKLDLYACVRPIQYFDGVPSPVKQPEKVDMIIFRENSEDIYAGIEFKAGTDANKKLRDFLINEMGVTSIRFPNTSGLGIKPISEEGTHRIVRAAIDYAIANRKPNVTLVHKGNIMKFTEGGFRDWGYQLAKDEYGAVDLDGGPWQTITLDNGFEITVGDVIADAFLQQILLRPENYDVIATMNLNGDYLSDALAAQVGGIGIAPGANINYVTGASIFEATHGTAPKYANLNKVNPSSVILSGEMMLRYMGWTEAADLLIEGVAGAIRGGRVTYDFARGMDNATEISTSDFGQEIIDNMG